MDEEIELKDNPTAEEGGELNGEIVVADEKIKKKAMERVQSMYDALKMKEEVDNEE